MIGRSLAQYQITALLGQGGMGEVYRAIDTRLRREVAVKVLPEALAADSDRIQRFQREARMLASLQHQSIASIYGLEFVDGIHFLVLELVDGEQLDERLERAPLALDESIDIASQIATALQAAHESGVVHRDLKPSNVMLKANGQVKVLDFGLAGCFDTQTDPEGEALRTVEADLTRAGAILGTPAYMSPEQALGRRVDARSDLFSFGILLYEMLTGAHPFRSQIGPGILDAILNSRAPAPSSIRTGLPNSLDDLVNRLLAKNPDERPESTAVVLKQLGLRGDDVQKKAVRTIAVLPFSSLSADPENEFLADGMSDEILTALSKIESLRVLSRTTSFAFKNRTEDVREIARTLDADIVLEGSLRRAGKRIRVTTQLTNAADGYHLWSDRFDREIEDVFAVQDEIAEKVAAALRIVLTGREAEALHSIPTDNIEAYELYLRGRTMLWSFTVEKFRAAQRLFRRAVELDEDFLPAWLGLTEASVWIYQWGINAHDEVDLKIAVEASQHAMKIAPHRAEAQAAKGITAWLQDDVDVAITALERAQQLDPRSWEAAYFLARVNLTRGDYRAAIGCFLRAAEIRPDDYQSLCLASSLIRDRDTPEELANISARALVVVERHLALYPDDARAHYLGASEHLRCGNEELARNWATRALKLAPGDGGTHYNVACLYTNLGDHEEALDLLDAMPAGWGSRAWFEKDPDLDPLREHPRFIALLDQMGK